MSGNFLFGFFGYQERKVSHDKIKDQTQQKGLADRFHMFLLNDHKQSLVPFLDCTAVYYGFWLPLASVQLPGRGGNSWQALQRNVTLSTLDLKESQKYSRFQREVADELRSRRR
ncbi:MAG: hypothetical protein IPJ71_18870 [Bdellovibrionales bacterium]|nr:hypothetical protein [Bdellovibrionales bacterium]